MNQSVVAKNVLEAAKPYLKDKTVVDLVVGISLIACQLSDGSVGVSYVLRYNLPPSCSAFAYAKQAIGKSAEEVAGWLVEKEDCLGRAIGSSVLTAASQQVDIPDDDDKERLFGLDFTSEDIVGMIGMIGPVAKVIEKKVKKLIIFDESVSACGGNMEVCPMEKQPEILPTCTKMIITGTSVINGSIDGLLDMCKNATEIAMVGSSTPMYSQGFAGTNITRLAGSWWKNDNKDEIFRAISQGAGIMEISPYMLKKVAFV